MKKILLLFSALFLTTMSAFAEDIIWSEDFSSYAKDDVPAGGDFSYVCTDGKNATKIYTDKMAGGEAPELLLNQSGGSITATVPLNGKSGEMTLSYKSNRDNLTVTVAEEGVTVGTATAAGTTYSYVITVPESVTSLTIKIAAGSKNARIDDIKLYQGTAKTPAGLAWGTASREVTIGSEENTFPTLTNDNNLNVTYSSSDEAVATIAADGTITLVAAGTTTISAAFAGDDTYEAQTVSYTLTVKAASTVDISNTPETAYTVAKALELIEAGEGLDTKVYVKGTIVSVKEISTSHGNATYYISDDGTATDQLTVFRGYSLEGNKFTNEEEIQDGDVVIVYGKLVNYNGTKEFTTGSSIYSLNGKTTGITAISAQGGAQKIFDLSGRKLSKLQKGVNIVNGKKVVK